MKRIINAISLLRENSSTLIQFEALYKIITMLIFTPLFIQCFNLIMRITGYSYLTFENVFDFLTNSTTLFALLLLVIIMTLYNMFDITTIIIILDLSYQKKKVKVMDAMTLSLKKLRKVFNLKNILLPFLVLFLIPFLNIGLSSSLISTIKIPNVIEDYIYSHTFLFIGFIVLMILFVILLIRWIYSLHYIVLEDKSFREARKQSAHLGHKKHLKDVFLLAVIQLSMLVLYGLFIALNILIIVLINRYIGSIYIQSFLISLFAFIIALSFIIFSILSTPISYCTISVLYYYRREELNEEISHVHYDKESNGRMNKNLRRTAIVLGSIAVIGGSFFIYNLYRGNVNLNIEYVRTMEVSAHRGASKSYPENTMAAFQGAVDLGADWIELDVQQTKDGQIIVMHDSNFKRVSNLDKNVWEVTYDEIKDLDVGSFFSEEFKGETIPLLEEVVQFANSNNIRLNIELKPTGHETDFEKQVVDIVNDYNFGRYCVITSQTYRSLEAVKKYDERIETVYVMSIAYGRITNLDYADNFSVEASNVTNSLVRRIHNEGKAIYVWTINSESSIRKMIDYNVDNIITDNITLAKNTIYESRTSNIINEYIKLIQSIF